MIAFVVAGTASGVGKTTTALALMAAFRERGFFVQPFKCGPDFLDTGHHTAICGRASRNLDTWMLSVEVNRELFSDACADADVAIVEGMMGLYDGVSGGGEQGSTAEIAKLLGLPVVLVLDASKSARSIAAVVKGFESFDPELRFAGLVLNGVSSEGHYRMLHDAIRSATATPILGRIPKDPSLAIPERHLGLRTATEESAPATRFEALAKTARTHLDLAPLRALESPHPRKQIAIPAANPRASLVRFGVAHDRAFSFYYADNLDLMHRHGIEVVEFSPIADETLLSSLDGLYLGGGYPELHAKALNKNHSMRAVIRSFAESGKPVYAECGGMVYLGRSLATLDGESFAMAGVLPCDFEMTSKLDRFGYAEVEFAHDCLLGARGQRARGHSFHYSRLKSADTADAPYRVSYTLSGKTEPEGFAHKNVLASYIHLHFRGNPSLVPALLHAAERARTAEVTA